MTFLYRRARVFKGFRFVMALVALGSVSAGICAAQVLRSSIAGRISDPSGASIPDAQITVTNQQTGVLAHTKTDSSGNYMVPELDPGVYSIKAEKQGFSTETETGLQVMAQETIRGDM